MERIDTDGALDLPLTAAGARVERSRRRSARSSNSDQAKDDTGKAESLQTELEIELSILQSNYEKCLNFGLKARTIQQETTDGQMPVLVIQMLNVDKCPTCGSWIVGRTCPIC